VRTRTFAWLLAAALGITGVLPFALRGDGTAIGHMRMVITYPATVFFAVLALGTLWLAAGLVSVELANRQLQSVAVKPVRAFHIWFGKWLGLLAVNACLVAVATLGLMLSVNTIARGYTDDPDSRAALRDQVLVGRRAVVAMSPPGLLDEAEQQRMALIAEGRIPESVPVDRFLQERKATRSIVSPGATGSWDIQLSRHHRERRSGQPLSLRYHFRCNPTERTPISGVWSLTAQGCNPVHIPINGVVDGIHHLVIPDKFRPSGETVTVSFSREATTDGPYLLFDTDAPVALLVHESGFTMNLIRSMLAVFCFIAAVAATGLMMGTLFSFPVALFSGGAVLFAIMLAASFSAEPVGHHHGEAPTPGLITRTAEPALLAIKHATADVISNIPLGALGNGMLFSWQQTGMCILLLLLAVPLILGSVSSLLLSQKELAA